MTRARNNWVLPISLLLAILLELLPLHGLLQPLRPYWPALVLAYWLLELPERVGPGLAFLFGVLGDLAYGSLLGEQALRLVVLAFIIERFRARLRFFPMSQQALSVGVLLLNDQIIVSVVQTVAGLPARPWSVWLGPLVGLALWPPLHLALDLARARRKG